MDRFTRCRAHPQSKVDEEVSDSSNHQEKSTTRADKKITTLRETVTLRQNP